MERSRFTEILKALPVWSGDGSEDEKKKWEKEHKKAFTDTAVDYLWATKGQLPEEELLIQRVNNTTDQQKAQIETIAERWKASIHDFVPGGGENWAHPGQSVCQACSAPQEDIRHRRQ